ncbi:hypothetical protein BST97_10055 [Nonlabens spongiae]|uniref:Uncharacterized protein n=1 Tax=Nonlabens spongiae TaxID=331648 RepID=A0A1W6ML16_9FLAO|nr:hypothetical protein [Nonlabens spongiae]ARN78304.1 hypothetical protein BST97_10055 [Nonlabens spongiae]
MKKTNNSNQLDKIIEGLDLAFDRMLEFKKYKKTPVIVEKDGKILEIDPEVLIEERNKEKKCS